MFIVMRIVVVLVSLFWMTGFLMATPVLDASAADSEIRIGNIMPYTGPLAAFGAIGKAEAAYFEMINARGGINGRKIRFISYDDSSDPRIALEQTRKLVEQDKVLLMFGSFGTPGNFAVRPYLNENNIPQLFVVSGDQEWDRPNAFPWTMGWQPPFRAEGQIFANYIEAYFPRRTIAVLWQNDQFGRDLYSGLEESLGNGASRIVADMTFDILDKSIERQIDVLQSQARRSWYLTERRQLPRSPFDGDKDDSGAVFGYAAAETLVQVLRQCGDELSRANIMRQAASLVNFHSSVLLPRITISTSATEFRPIGQMQLVQFDGRSWVPIGNVLDTAFVGAANH